MRDEGAVDGEAAVGAATDARAAPAHWRRNLVAHLGEIVSVVAADGTVLQVNRGPGSAAGPVGASSLDFVHPDDRSVVADAFAELLGEPGARTRTLVRVAHPGAAFRHVETTGINLLHEPDVGGLVFVSRDVEDRVRLERTAARSLEAQRLVADLGVRLLVEGEVEPLLADALAATAGLLEADTLVLLERDPAGELRVTRMHGAAAVPPGTPVPSDPVERRREAVERGVVTVLAAPLRVPGGADGVLAAGWTTAHPGDDAQRQLLQEVADVLAAARRRERRETDAVVRALHDPLTGLPTRPLLLDRLDHALRRAARGGTEVAVLVVDLDRFKEVNDVHGHAAGDAVLTELGARLAGSVRPGDTASRLGGDEFVVLCEDVAGPAAVDEVVDRVRRVFTRPFPLPGGGPLVLSGSVGSALSGPGRHDRAALLDAADRAMYDDKRRRPAAPAG